MDSPEYGKVVFERDRSTTTLGLILIGLFVLFLVEVGITATLVMDQQFGGLQIVGMLPIIGIGAALYWHVWANRVNIVTYYENGISHTTRKGTRSVHLEDIEGLKYYAEARSLDDLYTGTVVKMKFRTSEGEIFEFKMIVHNPEKHLGVLRDGVADRLARRFLKVYEKGQEVPWIKDVQFVREGVEIISSGKVIPFDSVVTKFHAGVLYLSESGKKGVLIKRLMSAENLFAGLALLKLLQEQASKGSPPKRLSQL
ncbi:MAG: hypothetical protein K8T89_09730 [Planctomycetes bacterium]|nr:hypothetical protein [Planctomycetota bacterium]